MDEIRFLPPMLRDLVEQLGWPVADVLRARFGGEVLYIPVNPPKRGRLASVLTKEELALLCQIYGGDRFYVPRGLSQVRHQRDEDVRRRKCREGLSTRLLAHRYGLTPRRIQVILQEGEVGKHASDDINKPS